ncbi:uncharacterized protein BX663DRAFT_482270 [Cokeromyces recurvatus]|uniref:uncharacterized protein n=1 Tax=Cokeromyces recurvatus TaxID=90255 RepID=UPI002220F543|nr:uncharacterized protein BX663DRAFT_482270 [Cokeromyces recurvatus]KAI7908033.1 hypothetical protein BX663DRAFT_482270 [Cokeromyces recurvatus]
MEIPGQLATFTLAPDFVPGTDFITRFLLQDERIMDIIVKDLVDQNVDQSAYGLGRCGWANKCISDVVYIPRLPQLSPVLIEVQCKMDEAFTRRLINYSLQLKQEYGQLPKVLVISIQNIATKVKSTLKISENDFMYTMTCDFWAESCHIISAESIEPHLNNIPLNKLVALSHFLTQQKRNILSVRKKNDPTIQLLYQISKDKFENECHIEEEKLIVINDLCFKAKTQFEKIVKCLQNGESTEKALKYAEDGQIYFYHQENKFKKDREITPIEDTPNISNLLTVDYHNDIIAADDATFIEEFQKKKIGRMSWERCFKEGRNKEFFLSYSNWKTLKSSYHGKSKKLSKRKIIEIEQ